MNRFKFDEMQMLTDGGWEGAFVEEIAEGDQIALKTWGHGDEPNIIFVTVERLRRIPRYERDERGNLLGSEPNYLMQFIGRHESGVAEPMAYGSGWAVFRRATTNERSDT